MPHVLSKNQKHVVQDIKGMQKHINVKYHFKSEK